MEKSDKRLALLMKIISENKATARHTRLTNALEEAACLLGMDNGVISHIEGDAYTVLHRYPEPANGESEQTLSLKDTYCSLTLENDDVLAIPDMKKSRHTAHPAYKRLSLETYIAAPFSVNGTRFGTINFSGKAARTEGFEESDLHLVKLLAEWVGSELYRMQITDELAREKEIYKLITMNSSELICMHKPDGSYTFVSDSCRSLLGYEPSEMIGRSPYDFFHKDDIERISNESHRLAKQGKPVKTLEYRIRRKDGSYIWFDSATEPVFNDSGEVMSLQTTSRDVTTRLLSQRKIELQNQRLSQEKKTKEKLYSILAHDLRNSLYGITSLLDITIAEIEDEDFTVDEVLEKLKLVQGSSIDSVKLLENIQNWVKIQTGNFEVYARYFDLFLQVQLTVSLFRPSFKSKNIEIKNSVERNTIVYGDSEMITTVIRNLLNNAIKYSHPGGSIEISAQICKKTDRTGFILKDHGLGMSKKVMRDLFDPLKRPHRKGTQNEIGTGLGLLLSQELTELNHGSLLVDSEEGKGTEFKLIMPNSEEAQKVTSHLTEWTF